MALKAANDSARKRAQNAIETYALSMYAILGHPSPGGSRIGQMAHEALPFLSSEDLRHPESPNLAALGQLQQLVLADIGANRPRNDFSAEAARAAQAASGTDGLRGGLGFGPIDASRGNSSARYRDLPSGDSVKGSGTSSSGGAVTAEFARSFAGSGMLGGTLRTFAEVGLDRSTFDAYRREGFSRADIADAANTAKVLDWKNDRQAFDDLQRSTKPQRTAIVEIDREKDAEKREALIQKKRHDLHIDDLPQTAQDRWQRNINRVQGKGRGVEHGHKVGEAMREHDAAVTAEHVGPKLSTDNAFQDRQGKQFAKTTVASFAAADKDDFGTSATPTPVKPATPKVADTKPAAPGSAPA